jgi:tetratricopeptide (TPR) repeat protein
VSPSLLVIGKARKAQRSKSRIAGASLLAIGRQQQAEANFKKALELNPGLPGNHEWLGLVYLAQGRVQDALVEIDREPMAALRLQGQAVAYYALGRKKESDTALSELIAKYQTSAASRSPTFMPSERSPTKNLSGWSELMSSTTAESQAPNGTRC